MPMGPWSSAACSRHGIHGAVRDEYLRAIYCQLLRSEHGQPFGGMAKPYQLRQLLALVERYDLSLEE